MGIETWALIVLVAVLVVYLLPFLVGRREAMRMANTEDRYSAGLRLLAAGSAAVPGGECVGGHAMIFRRRPEVRVMNRPEVRNVRALRKERELARLRQAHERSRERRRVAASHRAAVALTLLGVTLGTVVVAAMTALPWWVVAVPGALLCASAGAGRRAARASAESERRERARIAAVEQELTALTGGSRANRAVEAATGRDAGAGLRQTDMEMQEPASEPLGRRAVVDALKSSGSARSAAETALRDTEAQDMSSKADTEFAAHDSEMSNEATEMAEAGRGAALREDDVPRPEAKRAEGTTLSADVAEHEAPGRSEDARDVKAPATPPQGWRPVSVPAPTYTLAARAPRRSYEPPLEEPFDSAPVPERPRNAHTYPAAAVETDTDETVFHPIDLEAVLERRRAGA
ncbi:hypothetical protein [Actinomyces sp.]|uniref:hypothetical protein n=1 Tax=Actinomyces sp. TaxID=29317 RepID=UPI0026DD104B|nr:hypothetical protein [Actinomyces sp.]MDO4900720.1 hypothetical protein [Actinomyces sp.]